ncbi:hypothetical protein ACJW30_05G219000 [Castanea mollissima]
MWKLKNGAETVGEERNNDDESGGSTGSETWLRALNGHLGRQVWDLGTPEELQQIEDARRGFSDRRFEKRHSSDLLMRIQFAKENPSFSTVPQIQVQDTEELTMEAACDGHWPGDYGGPMFLIPGLVITLSITGALNTVLSKEHIRDICRYLYNHHARIFSCSLERITALLIIYFFCLQFCGNLFNDFIPHTLNKDGGWGLHIEGPSTMFGTALNYVTLRLLGEGAEDGLEAMEQAQKWILDHGGATAITSRRKMWLSVLGVYEWSGNNPLPPEIWLFPYLLSLSSRFVGPITSTIRSLRKELNTVPYHEIDWNEARNLCAKEDLYYPHPLVQDILWGSLYYAYEPVFMRWPAKKLREKALQTVMQHIHYEDENTRYICIGPVNKVLNMLCCWAEDPNLEAFKLHLPRIFDYLWIAEDGMKMQGYNGSQSWDTSFAIQAIISTNIAEEYGATLRKAHDYIKDTQVLEDCPGDLNFWYRHISKGAWPFSTADHGWPISDCTAEGLKAVLLLSTFPSETVGKLLDLKRLYDAVNVLLPYRSLQNSNGGFATYELTRSYQWLEIINPAETFGDIVIDYPIGGEEIENCIAKAAEFIEKIQASDGSWYGSWGVCFTYGGWFGIKGLVTAGRTYKNCSSIRKASNYLLSKEVASGGWGESYLSCQNKVVYTNLEDNRPHIVYTGWAMLALINAGQAERDSTPLHCAARILINSQMENGDFPQEQPVGSIFLRAPLVLIFVAFPVSWPLNPLCQRVLLPL